MVNQKLGDELYDPRRGGEALRVENLSLKGALVQPRRTNCFAVYFIESGSGHYWADAAKFPFGSRSLIFFVPYQTVRFEPEGPVQGMVTYFHANFLCVETFHSEVGCSGILFNDPYGVPTVELDDTTFEEVAALTERIQRETIEHRKAFGEVILSYLKVLLVLATRLKMSATSGASMARESTAAEFRCPVVAEFGELIEQHYSTHHSPSDYATLLHVSPKTLGRLVRERLGTTPTELIRKRILTHAKWHLLHTLKPVKEIARELGYDDELYFSRMFKKATGYSPTYFREFETEIRGGSNLSMFISDAPIQPAHPGGDNPLESLKNA